MNNKKQNTGSILLIRLTSIGDVLLTTPLLRILRNIYPKVRIDVLTTKRMIDIFKFNPHIDNLYTVNRHAGILELRKKKEEFFTNIQYDTTIDLQNNKKSKLLRKHTSKNILEFDKRRLYKLRLVYLKTKPDTFSPISDLYIKTAEILGSEPDGKGLEFWLPEDKIRNLYLSGKNNDSNKKIVIAPGAFHSTKRLPIEKFQQLIARLLNDNAGISIVGGKEDVEIASELAVKFNGQINNYTGQLSLAETAEIIDKANCVISNDTAVMHIAAARQTPVVALFGSTVQELGFVPYNSSYRIIEKELDCRPCTHYGKSKCPKSHFNCMNLISVDEIYKAVLELTG